MPFEQKDNSGTIFPNDKQGNDKRPDYTGKAMIGGVMYYVSQWDGTTQKGAPKRGLKFESVESANARKAANSTRQAPPAPRAPAPEVQGSFADTSEAVPPF